MPSAVPRRLTHFNAALEAEVDLRPAEEMWFDGDGDYKVHAFVITPHGFDPAKRYPLLLNVHGGPQMQWADAFRGDWQVYPGKGYVVAFCNPTGSTGYSFSAGGPILGPTARNLVVTPIAGYLTTIRSVVVGPG